MTRPSAGIRILAILPIMLVLFTARLYGTPQDVGPCVIDGIDVTNAPDILAIEDDMMADMTAIDTSLVRDLAEWVQIDNMLKLLRDYAPASCRGDDVNALAGVDVRESPPERRLYIGFDPSSPTGDGRDTPSLTGDPLRVIGSRFRRVVRRGDSPWTLVVYPPNKVSLQDLVETGRRVATNPEIPYADRVLDNLDYIELVRVPRIEPVGRCYRIATLTFVARRVFDAPFPGPVRLNLPTEADSLRIRKSTSELTAASLRAWIKDVANLTRQCEVAVGDDLLLLYTSTEIDFLRILYGSEFDKWEAFWGEVIARIETLKGDVDLEGQPNGPENSQENGPGDVPVPN